MGSGSFAMLVDECDCLLMCLLFWGFRRCALCFVWRWRSDGGATKLLLLLWIEVSLGDEWGDAVSSVVDVVTMDASPWVDLVNDSSFLVENWAL